MIDGRENESNKNGLDEGGAKGDEASGSSVKERPPNPHGSAFRHCNNAPPCLVRHASLMKPIGETIRTTKNRGGVTTYFIPVLRSGGWADIGVRQNMEDTHVCIDNFADKFGCSSLGDGPWALYGVFDGHGGKHAAQFVCDKLPNLIVKDMHFPSEVEKAVRRAFLHIDTAFAEACSLNTCLSSGTTALVAMIFGRYLLVANAGDCRAVLSRQGKAIEMSRDHNTDCSRERKRIEASGGYIDDGYLNGHLTVTRALGDWHMEGMKTNSVGARGPLSAEPELKRITLTEEDEFLIIGCDGLWEVFRSQNAVDFARRKLQEHNDPLVCCKELIDEALKRKTADNLTVVVVCFHTEPPTNLVAPRQPVRRSISAEGLRGLQSYLDSLRD
ncbi:probable protein phosphatase 2C 57 [Cryptomeria japonica]|uniref:probable protein phosphatase 2C 57 n=1 Tax=Cryptomeria japonica TaxID=3369 RepID=UPI0027D9D963|nr:probable protein phosphatase 2C 57 [Cryptomeria japonica]XP_057858554.2 probable protein phosphatase 2C 57 [Cryptomeria japonica]